MDDLPAIDILKVYTMLKELRADVLDSVKAVSARVALVEKSSIELRQSIDRLAHEYADTRVKRLEEEAQEAEQEYNLLQERLKNVEAKVEQKKTASVSALTTSEKIKQSVTLTYEQEEERKHKERDAVWLKRWDSVVTALLVSGAVGLAGVVTGAVWWLFQFYMTNKVP